MWPIFITLVIALCGGSIFYICGIPLAWMLGAYVATGACQFYFKNRMSTFSLQLPAKLRNFAFPLIGISIGLHFEVGNIQHMTLWISSMVLLIIQTLFMIFCLFWTLRRLLHFPHLTALLSAIPGGMTESIILAQTYGGDQQTVTVMQIIRIIFIVSLLPFMIVAFQIPDRVGIMSGGTHMPVLFSLGGYHLDSITQEWGGLIAGAWGIAYIGRKLTLPAAQLLGPIILGACLTGFWEWSQHTPNWMMPVAQIIIGATIGCRFAALPLKSLGRFILYAMAMALFLTCVASVFAAFAAWYFQAPYFPFFLSYIPGGMSEISVVSLTLDLDAPFITSHHLARVILILISINLYLRWCVPIKTKNES